jgi:chemosensory pili system protein ChpA (sensor histidine kinase/response regulator)
VVKISAQLLEQLVNLAGETSIARGRAEEQVNEFVFSLDEMQITVDRLHEQVRRLDLETEAQMLFRQEQVESEGLEGFDPLEFDRYSLLQQLSRSLLESASDLVDIKNTLAEKSRDMETLLVQQSRINTELQEGLMRSRMVPFARMVPRLRRIVRQVAGELEKQVEFYVDNAEGELDRTVLERIVAPLEHMLRNALDHGVESVAERVAAAKPEQGTIVLSVTREGGDVVLTLTDDGRGIDLNAVRAKAISRGLMESGASLSDHEIMQFILQSGFSTAKQVTQISGRGVGMDVVYSEIKQLGGNLEIDSAWGKGTRFIIRLPFTVSVNRALMVAGCGDVYAIPLNTIEGIVRVSPFELEAYYQPDAPLFEYAGQPYLMRYIGALLRTGDKPNLEGHTTPLPVLLVRGSDHAVAIQVDSLMGSREIVVKTLGPQFGLVQGLSGATVLGDGSVVVILDLMAMIRADASHLHRDLMLGQEEAHADRDRPLLVMVVDDSVTVRKVTSRFLERQGMEVILAKDGIDAINLLQDSDRIPDVMLLDIEMPRMDGFEVASRIRHTSRLRDLPIIMITSRTGDKHRDRAAQLGVNKYLGKPYQETLLLETIHELTGTVTSE